ncbi:hypothetical protein QJS10_CPA02g00150 [Acorus calamus]|uniref:EF-hand domain-containing protein n=1 Tax=Acorus calamus TaxID=4465 RepID=A0AAV9FF36_ACOCL|nr:hypothetical protein QJS10_CPA02g00150 [Acorus calamus]
MGRNPSRCRTHNPVSSSPWTEETSVFDVNEHRSISAKELHLCRVAATPSVTVLKRLGEDSNGRICFDEFKRFRRTGGRSGRCAAVEKVVAQGDGGLGMDVEYLLDEVHVCLAFDRAFM